LAIWFWLCFYQHSVLIFGKYANVGLIIFIIFLHYLRHFFFAYLIFQQIQLLVKIIIILLFALCLGYFIIVNELAIIVSIFLFKTFSCIIHSLFSTLSRLTALLAFYFSGLCNSLFYFL
jgi:hypothetical protein